MSFAFRLYLGGDHYTDDDYTRRVLTAIDLHRGDVSLVNQGANELTDIAARARGNAPQRRAGIDLRTWEARAKYLLYQLRHGSIDIATYHRHFAALGPKPAGPDLLTCQARALSLKLHKS